MIALNKLVHGSIVRKRYFPSSQEGGTFFQELTKQYGFSRREISGNIVERTLVKTAIYSFIISFSLLVLIPRERYTTDLNGMTSVEVTPYSEFFFMNLKYSIIITLIMGISIVLYKKYKS